MAVIVQAFRAYPHKIGFVVDSPSGFRDRPLQISWGRKWRSRRTILLTDPPFIAWRVADRRKIFCMACRPSSMCLVMPVVLPIPLSFLVRPCSMLFAYVRIALSDGRGWSRENGVEKHGAFEKKILAIWIIGLLLRNRVFRLSDNPLSLNGRPWRRRRTEDRRIHRHLLNLNSPPPSVKSSSFTVGPCTTRAVLGFCRFCRSAVKSSQFFLIV